MSLKHLEHDGNENFLKKKNFPNRKEDKAAAVMKELKEEVAAIQEKDRQQREWMSLNNPFLWDGEI